MSFEWLRSVHSRSADRRRRRDRRSRHVLFTDWRWALEGRRGGTRRREDVAETGVDLYPAGLIALALGIFLLSCLDAAFTLLLIHNGVATEANPLMEALMRYDIQIFVNLKLVITGGGLLFLVTLADAQLLRSIRVRNVMHALFALYGVIVFIELLQLRLLT